MCVRDVDEDDVMVRRRSATAALPVEMMMMIIIIIIIIIYPHLYHKPNATACCRCELLRARRLHNRAGSARRHTMHEQRQKYYGFVVLFWRAGGNLQGAELYRHGSDDDNRLMLQEGTTY